MCRFTCQHFDTQTNPVLHRFPPVLSYLRAVSGSKMRGNFRLIVERTRAGLEAAKLRGRVGGRPRKMTERKVEAAKKLFAAGTPPKDIAENLGVSVPTLYRWVPAAERDV